MVAALFKSVCPGAIRRRRAPSATVIVISGPASDLSTRELLLIDFTTPTVFAVAPGATAPALLCDAPALSCASKGVNSARAAPSAQIASDSVQRTANVLLLVTNQNSPDYRVSQNYLASSGRSPRSGTASAPSCSYCHFPADIYYER